MLSRRYLNWCSRKARNNCQAWAGYINSFPIVCVAGTSMPLANSKRTRLHTDKNRAFPCNNLFQRHRCLYNVCFGFCVCFRFWHIQAVFDGHRINVHDSGAACVLKVKWVGFCLFRPLLSLSYFVPVGFVYVYSILLTVVVLFFRLFVPSFSVLLVFNNPFLIICPRFLLGVFWFLVRCSFFFGVLPCRSDHK